MNWQVLLILGAFCACGQAADIPAAARFHKSAQPILQKYCSDCHFDGMKKGGVAFDEFKSDDALIAKHDLWQAVLKNTRAALSPPHKKAQPTAEERQQLEQWIKYSAFEIDPKNPDPGRVTVRRLNRTEYHNTIHDLMGVDYNTAVEFPADDTGFGFDNIGDVLTVSPMLLEKYMAAAKAIVSEAVPTEAKAVPEEIISGGRFRRTDNGKSTRDESRKETATSLSFYEPATLTKKFNAEHSGTYQLTWELEVKGQFETDPGKCSVTLKTDNVGRLKKEFGWENHRTFRLDTEEKWTPGEHRIVLDLQPLTPIVQKINSLELLLCSVTVRGPIEHQTKPKNYDRFFSRAAPQNLAGRRAYAAEVLRKFATKAFRRPADDATVNRLVAVAEKVYTRPGKTFEAGIADAMVAALSSPRFLFRLEQGDPGAPSGAAFALVDEFSLASRLSYFLWSTMPDDELFGLAARGELRKNLSAQVTRMLADSRSHELVQNFTGQWLQT